MPGNTTTGPHPVSRATRQAKILDLLDQYRISSQVQLSELLLDENIDVTQATLSRDLDELGAKKIRVGVGRSFYTVSPVESTACEPCPARMTSCVECSVTFSSPPITRQT